MVCRGRCPVNVYTSINFLKFWRIDFFNINLKFFRLAGIKANSSVVPVAPEDSTSSTHGNSLVRPPHSSGASFCAVRPSTHVHGEEQRFYCVATHSLACQTNPVAAALIKHCLRSEQSSEMVAFLHFAHAAGTGG